MNTGENISSFATPQILPKTFQVATCRILLNSPLGVWKCDETLSRVPSLEKDCPGTAICGDKTRYPQMLIAITFIC